MRTDHNGSKVPHFASIYRALNHLRVHHKGLKGLFNIKDITGGRITLNYFHLGSNIPPHQYPPVYTTLSLNISLLVSTDRSTPPSVYTSLSSSRLTGLHHPQSIHLSPHLDWPVYTTLSLWSTPSSVYPSHSSSRLTDLHLPQSTHLSLHLDWPVYTILSLLISLLIHAHYTIHHLLISLSTVLISNSHHLSFQSLIWYKPLPI